MTSDEHREKCFEVMEAACWDIWADSGLPWPGSSASIRKIVKAAFYALPTADARVVPVEATEEMLLSASEFDENSQQNARRVWFLRAAAGDLTNDPDAGLPTAADVRGILKPEGKP